MLSGVGAATLFLSLRVRPTPKSYYFSTGSLELFGTPRLDSCSKPPPSHTPNSMLLGCRGKAAATVCPGGLNIELGGQGGATLIGGRRERHTR